MHIGIDLDNTLVCYDELFWQLAAERGWIDAAIPRRKDSVRNALRSAGREADWTLLQGEAYGLKMDHAIPFPGARHALQALHELGHELSIVSHRTRQPIAGPPCDLHAAAKKWLSSNGFRDPKNTGIAPDCVFLEVDKAGKLSRIASIGCQWFIDDLPELLTDPEFPGTVRRVLFDPHQQHQELPQDVLVMRDWSQLAGLISEAAT